MLSVLTAIGVSYLLESHRTRPLNIFILWLTTSCSGERSKSRIAGFASLFRNLMNRLLFIAPLLLRRGSIDQQRRVLFWKVAQCAEDWVWGRLAKTAQAGLLDQLAELLQPLQVCVCRFAGAHLRE